MKAEKVWAALMRYDRELAAMHYKVKQFERAEYDIKGQLPRAVMLAHCRWMAGYAMSVFRSEYEEARKQAEAGGFGITRCVELMDEAFKSLGKAMRWLCYIQGVCHALGVYSCNELRDHSRGDEGEFKTAHEEHVRPAYGPSPGNALVEADFAGVELKNDKFTAMSMDHLEPGVIAMGGPPPESMVNKTPPSPAQLISAANLLAEYGFVTDPVRVALDTPSDQRTPKQVKLLKGTVFGCCDRHADNQGCSCVAEAEARDKRYGELEKEHLGDPDKKTGIYAPKVGPAQVEEIKKIAEKQSFTIHDPPKPPHNGYGASSDADWDAE